MAKKKAEHVFSCSQLDTAACKRRFYWSYVKGYEPNVREWNMMGGSVVHKALEVWYSTRDQTAAIDAAEQLAEDFSQSGYMTVDDEYARDKHLAMVRGIMDVYKTVYPEDDDWNVLHTEAEFDKIRINGFLFKGVLDLLATTSSGRVFVMDHKLKSRITGDLLAVLPQQYQTVLYTAVASIIAGKPVTEMVYNMIQKPGIYQGKKETCAQFLVRLRNEFSKVPTKYFHRETVRMGEKRAKKLLSNMAEKCKLLTGMMDKNIVKAYYREPSLCAQYMRACAYLPLCMNGTRSDVLTNYTVKE